MKILRKLTLAGAALMLANFLVAQTTPEQGKKPEQINAASQAQVNQPVRPPRPIKPNLYREVNQIPNLSPEQKQEFNKIRTEYYKLQRDLMQEKADDNRMKKELEAKIKEHQAKFAEMVKGNKEQADYYAKNIAGKEYIWEKPVPMQAPGKPMDQAKPADGTTPAPMPIEKKKAEKK